MVLCKKYEHDKQRCSIQKGILISTYILCGQFIHANTFLTHYCLTGTFLPAMQKKKNCF